MVHVTEAEMPLGEAGIGVGLGRRLLRRMLSQPAWDRAVTPFGGAGQGMRHRMVCTKEQQIEQD